MFAAIISMKLAVRQMFHRMGIDVRLVHANQEDPSFKLHRDLYSKEVLARKPFYNVGAGDFQHPYWTNVDKPSDWYADHQDKQEFIAYDLMADDPLPIENDSAEIIYTSHTLEHITNEAAGWFFTESFRALRPGGILRVTVPDADLFYRAFRRGDRRFDNMVRIYNTAKKARSICIDRPPSELSNQQLFLWRMATSTSVHHIDGSPERITDEQLDHALATMGFPAALDFCTSKCDLEVQQRNPGNHINWWTFDKFKDMLEAVGFSEVVRSGFGQSASPLLRDTRMFDNTHPEFSLYVEVIKP